MAKEKKYKRHGKKHEDSNYRKASSETYNDESTDEELRRLLPEKKVGGPLFPLERLMTTKRGKRIHLIDGFPDTLSSEDPKGIKDIIADKNQWYKLVALCGAGKPNQEFPKGSAIPLASKITDEVKRKVFNEGGVQQLRDNGVRLTCYKCIKLHYMKIMADATDEADQPLSLEVRKFFPTHERNREDHIMVPQGRNGFFGAGRFSNDRAEMSTRISQNDDGQIIGYKNYFAKSRWVPGIEEARTQPISLKYIGKRTAQEIADLLDFQLRSESFGQIVREALGKVGNVYVYDALAPQGSETDVDTVFDKLYDLYRLRRDLAQESYDRAKARSKGFAKPNPLLDIDSRLLDGFEIFLRRNYVQSKQ